MDFVAIAQQCAPAVHPQTMAAIVHVESSVNPYAIGVVDGRLERQPRNKAEAVATAQALAAAGYNFSLGLGQVNRFNLPKYGLDYEQAFDSCQNLRVASLILKECFDRARHRINDEQGALRAAFSCYYSGNFSAGFRPDFAGQPSYVQKVLNAASSAGTSQAAPIRVIRSSTPKSQIAKEALRPPSKPEAGLYSDNTTRESAMVYR